MKEEEAKEKICPQFLSAMTIAAAGAAEAGASEKAISILMSNSTCLASECMMWVEDFREVTEADERMCDLYRAGQNNMPDGGHCGLTKGGE